ncbi:FUSC family protein [Ktedonospora formicarum]|uniref:Integral membrane bound transporter domain-containing protein n=1 Tax=Ktedonospora formicarum TaxID=2778364 RepID=A0A8J3I6L3_9CHLR|nr:FUSC family protein [Ktedonospora formicarum]GHO46987.1 hypothetical protein KSX_51500 [Ktedonospora formicarum]
MSWLTQLYLSFLSSLRAATRDVLHVNRHDIWYSLRVLTVILVPLLVSGLFPHLPGFPDNTVFLELGAFFTMLAIPDGSYSRRARIMGLGVCLEAGACIAGTLLGKQALLSAVVVVFWAFGTGMLTAFGKAGGKLGYITTACFVIALASPASLPLAGLRCAILLSGAVWAMVLHLWVWPIRKYQPLKQTVARYYCALQAVLTTLHLRIVGNAQGNERHTEEFWKQRTSLQNIRKEAHQIFDEVHCGTNPTAQRLAFFLGQADALFNVEIAFAESLRTFPLQHASPVVQETLMQASAVLKQTLTYLSQAIWSGQSGRRKNGLTKALQDVVEKLAEAGALPTEENTDAQAQAHLLHLLHLLKQLVTLCQRSLTAMDTAIPKAPVTQVRQRPSLRTMLANAWHTLANHLNTRSRIVRYALRLSITISIATALFLFLRIPHGYWMAMSVLIVLKPDFHTTHQRTRLRLGGTIAGGIFAGALSLIVYQQGLLLLLIALLCFLAFLVRSRHYGIYAFFLSSFLILSLDIAHPGNWTVALIRIASNLIGAALAYLSIYLLWPRWEKKGLPDQVGSALASIRHFFHGAISLYILPSSSPMNMRELRLVASQECTRAIHLLERLSLEPWSSPDDLTRYAILRLSLRQLCESIIALSHLLSPARKPYQTLPDAARLPAQIEEALENIEDAIRRGCFPNDILQVQKRLLALQETLRGIQTVQCNEQSPQLPHHELPVMPAPLLGVYLPFLVQTLSELSLAGNNLSREERQENHPSYAEARGQ